MYEEVKGRPLFLVAEELGLSIHRLKPTPAGPPRATLGEAG